MDIDWFTVAAQVINFLILAWLLKKVLYQPILNAMAKREARIAERLRVAHDRAQEARKEQNRYRTLREELHAAQTAQMQQAKKAAEEFRVQLQDEARREVEASRQNWLQTLDQEKSSFLDETSRAIASFFRDLAVHAFQELATAELEEKMMDHFLTKLPELSTADHEAIGYRLREGRETLVITSAFALSELGRKKILGTLAETWSLPVNGEFLVNPRLLAGIELEIGGKKISWTLNRYLRDFDQRLQNHLERAK